MTKLEYAKRYDAVAAQLYRFALYALGDPLLAERAVREAFVEGWRSRLDCGGDAFLHGMLALLTRFCRRVRAAGGERYEKGLRAACKFRPDPCLTSVLGAMRYPERVSLLLACLFGIGVPEQKTLGLSEKPNAASSFQSA